MAIAVKYSKIGVMGGSFDPIHNGHLRTAEFVMNKLGLEKIIFIPAYIAPHKIGLEYAGPDERFQMTALAAKENPRFAVSSLELERGGISYTYDTLTKLKELYGEACELYFLIGGDALPELPTWHRAKEMLNLCSFVAATRPGFETTVDRVAQEFGPLGKERIIWLKTPETDISSTEIRRRVCQGQPIDTLVPESVAGYIKEKGLYSS